MLAESCLEVANEVEHLLLGSLREMFFHIKAADCLTHVAVGHTECAFPAGTLLLHAALYFGEFECCVGEFVAEVGSSLSHIFPQVIVLDFAVGKRCQQVVGLLHPLWLGKDEFLGGVDVHRFHEIAAPVDIGIVGLELFEAAWVVHGHDVAALFTCEG